MNALQSCREERTRRVFDKGTNPTMADLDSTTTNMALEWPLLETLVLFESMQRWPALGQEQGQRRRWTTTPWWLKSENAEEDDRRRHEPKGQADGRKRNQKRTTQTKKSFNHGQSGTKHPTRAIFRQVRALTPSDKKARARDLLILSLLQSDAATCM